MARLDRRRDLTSHPLPVKLLLQESTAMKLNIPTCEGKDDAVLIQSLPRTDFLSTKSCRVMPTAYVDFLQVCDK